LVRSQTLHPAEVRAHPWQLYYLTPTYAATSTSDSMSILEQHKRESRTRRRLSPLREVFVQVLRPCGNGLLAMLLYLNHKCTTDDRFRKTFLVLTLIFVFMLWSPWNRWNCSVFGLCPGPSSAVSKNSADQSKSKLRRVKRPARISPTSTSVQIPAEPLAQVAVKP
jgi:hypothetical protein